MCALISAAASVSSGSASSNAAVSPAPLSINLGDGCQLVRGGPGDHGPAHQLLSAVFKSPTRDSFSASLDNPFYEPNDRVLVRRGLRVVSHAQVTQRTIRFGSIDLPVAGLHALATLPEFRSRGFATAVVSAAEDLMIAEGAELGMLVTAEPHFFRARGWVVCGRQSLARAHTRHVLAELSHRGVPPPADLPHIRPLRQVELPSVMKVYAAATFGSYGALDRSEAYWRWLATRGGFDHIFVAMGGDDRRAWDAFDSPVIGYVVVKENQILELFTVPVVDGEFSREQISEHLLARACHEAIERDLHVVQYHAPHHDRLFDLFRICGGELHQREQYQNEVQMAKLFNPARFVDRLAPELQRRIAEAGVKTSQLGLSIGGDKRRLDVNRRGVKLKKAAVGRNYLRLNEAEWVRLLLGHDDVSGAIAQRRVHASTRAARETARTLFPSLDLWRSPWDELYL